VLFRSVWINTDASGVLLREIALVPGGAAQVRITLE